MFDVIITNEQVEDSTNTASSLVSVTVLCANLPAFELSFAPIQDEFISHQFETEPYTVGCEFEYTVTMADGTEVPAFIELVDGLLTISPTIDYDPGVYDFVVTATIISEPEKSTDIPIDLEVI